MNPDTRYNLERIIVPPGWSAMDDIEEAEDLYGPMHDYFAAAMEQVDNHRDNLQEALERRLIYFGEGKNSGLVGSVPDKIARLEALLQSGLDITHQGPVTEDYRDRLAFDLQYCKFVWSEHERIVGAYDCKGEQTLLHPLIELANHLSSAADGLDGVF